MILESMWYNPEYWNWDLILTVLCLGIVAWTLKMLGISTMVIVYGIILFFIVLWANN